MSTEASLTPPPPAPSGLSQMERLFDTFVAPSKTFTDIRRDASWWMPFLLILVFTLAQAFVIDRQVGFDRVAENQVHASPKSEDQLNQLPPDQRAARIEMSAKITRVITYVSPVMLLIFFGLYALILWAAFNFGFGAQTTFWQAFAVTWYAALPYIFRSLLVIITLLAGGDAENFNQQNPVGTNLAYYLPDLAPWLKTLLSQIDLVALWSMALAVMGMAIVAKKSVAQSAIIVVGMWLLTLVVSTGLTAAFS